MAFLNQLTLAIGDVMQHEAKLVRGKLENLKKSLRAVRLVLAVAEKRQWSDDEVKLWMDELNDVSYDTIDAFDEFTTVFLPSQETSEDDQNDSSFAEKIKVRLSVLDRHFRSSSTERASRFLNHKIGILNERLDEIAARKERFNFSETNRIFFHEPICAKFGTSIIDLPVLYGQDQHKEAVLNRLSEENEGFCVIAVVGMGGIGKNVLAKLVYDDEKIKAGFDARAWVRVSKTFDRFEIVKAIYGQLGCGDEISTEVDQREMLRKMFLGSIKDKRFLLVLDDVWTVDLQEWGKLENDLRSVAMGSRVVVMTRKKQVVEMIGEKNMVFMEELSEKERWLLFKEIEFFEKSKGEQEDLNQIGEEIVAKCKGLPLAVKLLASLLRGKRKKEWQHVLQNDLWELENVELEEAKKNFLSPLLLSFYDLPPTESVVSHIVPSFRKIT